MMSAVLFDMDGVVIDSMGQHEEAWRKVFRDEGIDLSPEDILKREGMSGPESLLDIYNEKKLPLPSDDKLNYLIDKKHGIFNENNISPFLGILTCLELLKERKILLALVTGSHMETVERILPEELREYFSAIITADHVKNGKPSPEPYLKALEKINVPVENAIAVENAPMGILSAKNAGLYCVALETTLPSEYLQKADIILSNHQKLYEYLESTFIILPLNTG